MNQNCIRNLALFGFLLFATGNGAFSQGFLGKLKEKVEKKVVDKVVGDDKKTDNTSNQSTATEQSSTTSSKSGSTVKNTKGGGLVNTPPDVSQNIKDANDAFTAKNYNDAKYSIRQALLGVEMEIGQKVLKSLPESVSGLDKIAEDDKVVGNSLGLVGLTIQRNYQKGDKQLKVSIGNDAAMLSAVTLYLDNAAYTGQNNDKNVKRTKFKGYRAILKYDESSGYTLSVPFGQSSVMIFEGVNFSDENDLMKAANNFDIEKIKSDLGEK